LGGIFSTVSFEQMSAITLDIRTMSFMSTSIAFLYAIGLLVFGRKQMKFKGFPRLAAGSSSFGIGLLLVGLRDYLPNFVTIILANMLITAGLVIYYEGTRQFLGGSNRIHPVGLVALLLQLGFFYTFIYLYPSVNNRIIVISLIATILSVFSMQELFRKIPKHWKVAGNMTAYIFLGYSLFQIYRVFITYRENSILSFMDAGTVHAFAFLAVIILIAGTSFGFIWMVSKSLEFELTELANHDQLTKILNRRGVATLARQEFSKMSRSASDLSIILTDIDHFKSVNVRFGHQIGDEVLAGFANLISNNLRPFDIFGRIGGEEFVIVLPNTSLDQAQILAERLRKHVDDFTYSFNGKDIQITASFGVANYIAETDTLEKLIPFADKALYRSKQLGRNTVTHYSLQDKDLKNE